MSKLPKFTPLGNRVLVLQSAESEKTDSGLYIPPNAQEKPHQGRVLSVGPGRRLEDGSLTEMSVTAGDIILFGKYSGQEIVVDGEHYLVMPEDDILGVVQ